MISRAARLNSPPHGDDIFLSDQDITAEIEVDPTDLATSRSQAQQALDEAAQAEADGRQEEPVEDEGANEPAVDDAAPTPEEEPASQVTRADGEEATAQEDGDEARKKEQTSQTEDKPAIDDAWSRIFSGRRLSADEFRVDDPHDAPRRASLMRFAAFFLCSGPDALL